MLCVNSGDGAWNSVGGRKRVTAGIIMIVTTIVREVLPPARCAPCRGTASSEAACIQGWDGRPILSRGACSDTFGPLTPDSYVHRKEENRPHVSSHGAISGHCPPFSELQSSVSKAWGWFFGQLTAHYKNTKSGQCLSQKAKVALLPGWASRKIRLVKQSIHLWLIKQLTPPHASLARYTVDGA